MWSFPLISACLYPRTSGASRTGTGPNLTLVPFYEPRMYGVLRSSSVGVIPSDEVRHSFVHPRPRHNRCQSRRSTPLDKRPQAAYYAVGNASSHDASRDRTTHRDGVMGGEDVPGERSGDPQALLPLTPVALNILLALADGERHGYGIMLEVRERTAG